ncbi:TetR/AcrR family transcriptional regulator [Actinocorallia sp. A-T 12471]|uniref:TetR/AcrR family transcriptional regulator n=1 Tax=Actinocorallia sp. A-T 12471 TaxID=3089813 RepID=UPI0029CB0102|nr:TetR/AcrR family transcriptional regulator C-terminal domain-containing protein [Actinocorallia sp. A-T 12471]MDX6741148.1 TetR/AcrR family transcriptional regulator C-terminal domain-containing protein [Actinocorallia sp. A-T 12471]
MARTRGRAPAGGRADALSQEIVVGTAVELLDEHGERGLTFRLLAQRLNTGPGALYWHVANKDELIALAADHVLGEALADAPRPEGGVAGLRALAVTVFDALDRHPWAAFRVTAPATLEHTLSLLDRIGVLVTQTGLPAERHFAVATAIFNYITGVSAQIISPAVTVDPSVHRDVFLAETAAHWSRLDPAAYPFLPHVTEALRDHDDRDQFTTGLDLLLTGLTATTRPPQR